MARKGESIFKRKDGRYEARYVKGYDLNNKIIYGYVYGKTYSIAKEKRNKLLLTLNLKPTKKNQYKNKKKFNSLLDSWLLQKRLTVKESTYSRYLDITNNHLRPTLGDLNIDALDHDVLANFIISKMKNGNLVTKEKLGEKTLKDIVTVLKQILNFGNLNLKISAPKVRKNEIQIFDKFTQEKIKSYILSNFNNTTFGIILGLYMGLRIGEVCGLRQCDIDLDNKLLHINHTIIRVKNLEQNSKRKTKVIMDTPKTEKSKRKIPIPDTIIPLCKKIKLNSYEYNFVLTNNRKFIEPRSYYNRYKKIMDHLNIENYDFHTLRHTFATNCIALGFDPKTLSEILGHSDVQITLALYVHPSDELKNISMNKLCLH